MWRFYHANMSCHATTLTFDPLTLKVCGRSGVTWSQSVLNLIEIDQLPAELFTIWQIFARVTSCCDRDLWPLDLELLWCSGVMFQCLCKIWAKSNNPLQSCWRFSTISPWNSWGGRVSTKGSQGCVDRTSPNLVRTYVRHVCSPSLFQSWDILLRF